MRGCLKAQAGVLGDVAQEMFLSLIAYRISRSCQIGSLGLRWQPLSRLPRHSRPSMALQPWLRDKGSLTAKLTSFSQGRFHVEVVRQIITRPELSEQRSLKMRDHEWALVREVVLYGKDQPWVFARSVIPLTSLTGSLRHLRKQDVRPLGAFLFSQPQLQRSAIAVSCINRHHHYLPAHLQGDEPLWARRSVFCLERKSLLVSEVFLPAFTANLELV